MNTGLRWNAVVLCQTSHMVRSRVVLGLFGPIKKKPANCQPLYVPSRRRFGSCSGIKITHHESLHSSRKTTRLVYIYTVYGSDHSKGRISGGALQYKVVGRIIYVLHWFRIRPVIFWSFSWIKKVFLSIEASYKKRVRKPERNLPTYHDCSIITPSTTIMSIGANEMCF